MNMDTCSTGPDIYKISVCFLFWISFFVFSFYHLVIFCFLPALCKLLSPSTQWIEFWKRKGLWFISGHRYFELFVFQLTVMFSNSGYVSCWKTGPSQELLAATDWFGWEPSYPWQAVEESHSVCAGGDSHSSEVGPLAKVTTHSAPSPLRWKNLFQANGNMLPWKKDSGVLKQIRLNLAPIFYQKLEGDYVVFKG